MEQDNKYDFVCSLGNSCMTAHNLDIRKLRFFSLPFDWVAYKSDVPIYKIADYFTTGFNGFLKKENLRELTKEEISNAHPNMVQYQDMESEIYFLNHFKKKIDTSNEYDIVKKKIDRRLKRLLNCISRSNKILFILASEKPVNENALIYLYNKITSVYDNKEIYIKSIQFSCEESSCNHIENGHIEICKYERKANIYDYTKTNYEWSFLDSLDVNLLKFPEKLRLYSFRKVKCNRGGVFSFLPFLHTMFQFKLYIFGIRLYFSIGEYKTE